MKKNVVSLVVLGALGLGGLLFWAGHQTQVLQTEMAIAAPPERVWQVLTDTGEYPQWNPVMVKMTGRLQAGNTIALENRTRDGQSMTFRPTILKAEANTELRWLGRLWVPGVFDGEHFFILTPTGDGKTLLQHGETFRGVLVPFVRGWLTGTIQADFHRINIALKARAEARG